MPQHQSKLQVQITNGETPVSVNPVEPNPIRKGQHGIVALTEPLTIFEAELVFMTNDTYGISMNQNAALGGDPLFIHNGTDTTDGSWTAQDIIGTKLTANSVLQANGGTRSIEIDNPAVNDVWEIDNGSPISLASYVAISMFIYVDKDWTFDSIEIYGWDGSIEVGNRVQLQDYFNQIDFNTWQSVIIPLTDMVLENESIEAFRMQMVTRGGSNKSPKFYIDDMQLEELGAPIVFKMIAPKKDVQFIVNSLVLNIAGPLTGVVTNGTMPGLAFNQLLGLTQLTNGLLFQRLVNGETSFAVPFRSLTDFFSAGWRITNNISDGTNTNITLEVEFKIPLKTIGSAEGNFIAITVQDNLSSLLRLTIAARGAFEV